MAINLNFANFAGSTLAADITDTASQLEISDYALFPEGQFTAVIWDASEGSPLDDPDSEIVLLEHSAEGTFDLYRARENTSAKPWQSGSNIANVVTADTIRQLIALTQQDDSAQAVTIKTATPASPAVSFGDGIVFADASESSFTITLPEGEGIYDTPLTIIKYDSTDNSVTLEPFEEEPYSAYMYGQYQSMTFVASSDGTIRQTGMQNHQPSSIRTIYGASVNLRGYERLVLVYTGASDLTMSLPNAEYARGNIVTVKKSDSGSGSITLSSPYNYIDGQLSHIITDQYGYVTVMSNGLNWYRVG